jgi:hypothetical protein
LFHAKHSAIQPVSNVVVGHCQPIYTTPIKNCFEFNYFLPYAYPIKAQASQEPMLLYNYRQGTEPENIMGGTSKKNFDSLEFFY